LNKDIYFFVEDKFKKYKKEHINIISSQSDIKQFDITEMICMENKDTEEQL